MLSALIYLAPSDQLKADLWAALVAEGLPSSAFIGQTPIIDSSLRHYEVKEWLDKHADKLMNVTWIVLDDMKLDHITELKGHFIQIDATIGLSAHDVDRALNVLLACGQCCT